MICLPFLSAMWGGHDWNPLAGMWGFHCCMKCGAMKDSL